LSLLSPHTLRLPSTVPVRSIKSIFRVVRTFTLTPLPPCPSTAPNTQLVSFKPSFKLLNPDARSLGRKSSWNGRTTVLRVCFLLFVDQTLRRLCGLSIDLSRRYPFTPTLLLATCFTIHVIGGASLIVERLVSFERK
jgi:hypothetical protein